MDLHQHCLSPALQEFCFVAAAAALAGVSWPANAAAATSANTAAAALMLLFLV
jgi:hypothetical protein